ncbi:MAG TPA: OpgC domain-containing protein [Chloroflexota bacterium]|nr:OpgC domain-containing protein [Chloroflexota bacterium]
MAVRTIQPPLYWPVVCWSGVLRSLLAACRYVATPVGRDLRLDFLRGFCVFAMVVDHVGGTSWLYAITGGNTSAVSAAEGFVFLSGLVMGLVYREKIRKLGLRGAARAALGRAWTLYGLTVALTLIFAALTQWTSLALWVGRERGLGVESWAQLVIATLTLHYTWHGTDILALYTLVVGAAPLVFFLLAEGRATLVLGASWGLWLLHQLFPRYVVVPWQVQNSETFPLAAWQVLFVTALVLGYHRLEIEKWVHRLTSQPLGERTRLRLGCAAAGCVALAVGWVWTTNSAAALTPGAVQVASLPDLFDKPSLGVGRLALFALLAGLALAATTYAWRPLQMTVGWLLIPLGQASLYVYALHLFLILVAYNVPPYVGSDQPGWELHNTLGQLGLVLALWAMVKTRFLFGLVPR